VSRSKVHRNDRNPGSRSTGGRVSGGRSAGKRARGGPARGAASGAALGPDGGLLARSLPGTELHKVSRLVVGAARGRAMGLADGPGEAGRHIQLGNPFHVSEELKARITSLRGAAERRLLAASFPDLALPRKLPLGTVSLVAGAALLATQRYWAAVFVAYGLVALIRNGLSRRRLMRQVLERVDAAVRPDLDRLREDRARADAVRRRFLESGTLGDPEQVEVPEDLPLPRDERVILFVPRAIKAMASNSGLVRESEGSLFVTEVRMLFVADGQVSEVPLSRIVRADVVDELRLTVTFSKREPSVSYIAPGSAHTLAAVVRLALEG
jgi:hypothetical protein